MLGGRKRRLIQPVGLALGLVLRVVLGGRRGPIQPVSLALGLKWSYPRCILNKSAYAPPHNAEIHLYGFAIGPFPLSGNNNTYFSYNFFEVLLLPLFLLVEVSDSKSQSMLYLGVYYRATITRSDTLFSLEVRVLYINSFNVF